MPIKGLSDRGLAFPEIGQVRKGAKKPENGKAPGADLTYFRVEFDETEKKTEAAFRAVYGDKPQWLRVILPFNEIERMWECWLEAYTAGRMVARSDGEFLTYQIDNEGNILVKNGLDKNGNKAPHPSDNIAGHDFQNKPVKFKPNGRLKIIIPDLARAAYLTVMTTSQHDIANISDQLAAFKELNNGQLAGIPFILRRRPRKISTPSEDGQRVRRVKWLVSIEADPEWVRAKLSNLKMLALPESVEGALVPAGEPMDEAVETEYDEDEIVEGGPEWGEQIVESNQPETEPQQVVAPDLPHNAEALRKIFAKEYNAALKSVNAKKLPTIKGNSSPDEIREAIGGLRALVAAA